MSKVMSKREKRIYAATVGNLAVFYAKTGNLPKVGNTWTLDIQFGDEGLARVKVEITEKHIKDVLEGPDFLDR